MEKSFANVVGTPTKKQWSQVHGLGAGQVIVVVSVEDQGEENEAALLGRELINKLERELGATEGPSFQDLRESVQKVAEGFAGQAKLQIAAAARASDRIYFCFWGQGKALLLRDRKQAVILQGEEDKASFISGKVRPGDLFLFGTNIFFENVDIAGVSGELQKAGTAQEVAELLAPRANLNLALLACAILQIKKEKSQAARSDPSRSPSLSLRPFIARIALKLPEQVPQLPGSSRKTTVAVGVILIMLLLVSIWFGVRQKSLREYRSGFEDRLVQAETLYSDSLLQKDVNRPRSRELFAQAQELASQLVSEGVQDKRLEELRAKLSQDAPQILGKVEFSAAGFLDLSLVRDNVQAAELAIDEEKLAVLDLEGARVISVSVEGKDTQVLAAKEGTGLASISIYQDQVYALTGDGVVRLSAKASSVVVEKDEEWGEVLKIKVFGSNIYLLDKSSGQVWRYPGIEEGFGSRQRWLGQGVTPDFSDSKDFAIDGSIWVLAGSGKILKFTRGAPDAFVPSGVEGQLTSARALYTDENLESVFILDGGNRIVELDKSGEYQKEYLWDGLADVRDFVVSKKVGKIFLLTQDKILETQLR